MNDLRKSALWALISIPISIFFAGVFLHGGPFFLEVLYIPGVIMMEILGDYIGSPERLFITAGLTAQYLGYFLFIFVLRKAFKLLAGTRAENMSKEGSETDPPTHLP